MAKSHLVPKLKVNSLITTGGTLIHLTYDLLTNKLLSRHVPYRLCDYSPGVHSWPRRLAYGHRRVDGQWFARVMKIERLGQIELQTTKTGRFLHVYTVHDRYLLDLAQLWKQVARQLVKQAAQQSAMAMMAMPGLRRGPTQEPGKAGAGQGRRCTMSEDFDKPKTTMYLVTEGAGLGHPVLVNEADLKEMEDKPLLQQGKLLWARHPTASQGFPVPFRYLKPTKLEAITTQIRLWQSAQDFFAHQSAQTASKIVVALEMIDSEAQALSRIEDPA